MHDCCETVGAARTHSRRAFVRSVALGGGVALLFGPRALAAGADILLLTCVDYRLEHQVLDYIDSMGLSEKYYHLALAGASLAALTNQRPAWGQTFWEHLAFTLGDGKPGNQGIRKVMVLDHRNCAAYRKFLGEGVERDRATELGVHTLYLRRLRSKIHEKHPKLEVALGLMELNGKVEDIA